MSEQHSRTRLVIVGVILATAVSVPLRAATDPFSAPLSWEAGRVVGVSTTYQAVSFSTPFTDFEPVVVVTSEGGPPGDYQAVIRNVTRASFEVRVNSAVPVNVHYFACTPGVWLVNGVLIYAAVYGGATQSREVTFFRPYPRTPAILATGCANANQDPQTTGVVYGLQTLQTSVTVDLDAGTRGAFVGINYGTSPCLQVIAIATTGPAHDEATYTSGGASSFKPGHRFESGFFRVPGPDQTGTVSFSGTGFSSSPIVVMTGVNTEAFNNNTAVQYIVSQPALTSFTWRNNNWPLGIMWLAVEIGHDSAQATRLF